MKIAELFLEVLSGNSKVKISWEQQSPSKSLGYFTLDNKIVYGIRKIALSRDISKKDFDISFIVFGWFDNGVLNYSLLRDSLYPNSVLNVILSEINAELKIGKMVIFLAKRNNESEELYQKRFSFYDALLQLRARKYGYSAVTFENEQHEMVFCITSDKTASKLSKIEVLKLCYTLNSDDWLSFSNAKRVLTSLKRIDTQ